ncbi:hypothetical protein [Nitrosopumilus sp. b2]|uniref:hypothetical protein n=1 Tax=Nitrosopumilus sp. b2 TaxID=2109908 RepID=UPI002107FD49|nr:hypothetical protein [Nitrosopumilus sp. b2]
MKTRLLIILAIGMLGFIGTAFAIHDPNQLLEHSIILPPDMKEKTFEEFMDWCEPYYGELCVKLEKNRTPTILSPLKQIQNGIYGQEIVCRDDKVLVLKKSSEFHSCITVDTVPKLFAREWALNEVRVIDTDKEEQGKAIKITGIIERLNTPEGFEYHLIPLREELPRIEYTGYDTLNLFSTKDTVHHFIRDLGGKLVKIEGKFLLDGGEYFRHFSGFPTVPVENVKIISDPEDLEYSINGAKIVSIVKTPDSEILNVVIQEAKEGTLEITIPRDLIDAKIGEHDDDFFVLVDGMEVDFEEERNSDERTLIISFEKDTRTIQIMGTFPL